MNKHINFVRLSLISLLMMLCGVNVMAAELPERTEDQHKQTYKDNSGVAAVGNGYRIKQVLYWDYREGTETQFKDKYTYDNYKLSLLEQIAFRQETGPYSYMSMYLIDYEYSIVTPNVSFKYAKYRVFQNIGWLIFHNAALSEDDAKAGKWTDVTICGTKGETEVYVNCSGSELGYLDAEWYPLNTRNGGTATKSYEQTVYVSTDLRPFTITKRNNYYALNKEGYDKGVVNQLPVKNTINVFPYHFSAYLNDKNKYTASTIGNTHIRVTNLLQADLGPDVFYCYYGQAGKVQNDFYLNGETKTKTIDFENDAEDWRYGGGYTINSPLRIHEVASQSTMKIHAKVYKGTGIYMIRNARRNSTDTFGTVKLEAGDNDITYDIEIQRNPDTGKDFNVEYDWYPSDAFANKKFIYKPYAKSTYIEDYISQPRYYDIGSYYYPNYKYRETEFTSDNTLEIRMPLTFVSGRDFFTSENSYGVSVKDKNTVALTMPVFFDEAVGQATVSEGKLSVTHGGNTSALLTYSSAENTQPEASTTKVKLSPMQKGLSVVQYDGRVVPLDKYVGSDITVTVSCPAGTIGNHKGSVEVLWNLVEMQGRDIDLTSDVKADGALGDEYSKSLTWVKGYALPDNLDGTDNTTFLFNESNYSFTVGEDKKSVDYKIPFKTEGYWNVSAIGAVTVFWNANGKKEQVVLPASSTVTETTADGLKVSYLTGNIPVDVNKYDYIPLKPSVMLSTTCRTGSGVVTNKEIQSTSGVYVCSAPRADNPDMPQTSNGNDAIRDGLYRMLSNGDRALFHLPVFGRGYNNGMVNSSEIMWKAPESADKNDHRFFTYTNMTNLYTGGAATTDKMSITFTVLSGEIVLTDATGKEQTFSADNGMPKTYTIDVKGELDPITNAAYIDFAWIPGEDVPHGTYVEFVANVNATSTTGDGMSVSKYLDGQFYTGNSSLMPEIQLVIPESLNGLYFSEAPQFVKTQASSGENDMNQYAAISWETDTEADFFEVYRRAAGSNDEWQAMPRTFINDEAGYCLDNTALPGVKYDYKVVAIVDCSGRKTSETVIEGVYRSLYARLSGKVQYSNGIRMSDMKIVAESTNHKYETFTKDDGTWVLDSVEYNIIDGEKYTVQVVSQEKFDFDYGAPGAKNLEVSVSTTNCNVPDINVICTSFVNMTGKVYYDGTTVPVVGAKFRIGYPGSDAMSLISDAKGMPVSTDADGSFSFSIPKNIDLKLSVFKEGHTFKNDGRLIYNGSDVIAARTEDLNQVRFKDVTRIKLRGRIAGGNEIAAIKQGFGLSKNVIGDDLQFVMQLEGDNVSTLVYDEDNQLKTTSDSTYTYKGYGEAGGDVKTVVNTELKRIVVHPDVKTGEYEISIIPTRWKITQATATGYGSLLPDGVTSQVIDLTDSLTAREVTYMIMPDMPDTVRTHATFNIVYKAPVEVYYTQTNYGVAPVKYFGEKTIAPKDLMASNRSEFSLFTENEATGEVTYAFGHPLFMSGHKYSMRFDAAQTYYYNNDKDRGAVYREALKGNRVRVFNGLDETTPLPIDVKLNGDGYTVVELTANNTSFHMTGDDALKKVEVYVEVDGDFVSANNALTGFVAGDRVNGVDTQSRYNNDVARSIVLDDILRNPPGVGSSATLSKGTSYTRSFDFNVSATLGVSVEASLGDDKSMFVGMFSGTVAVPGGAASGYEKGNSMKFSYMDSKDVKVTSTFVYDNNISYTYSLNENISTNPSLPGNDGNIYIGTDISASIISSESFCVINEETFRRMQGAIKSGRMRVISQGTSASGEPYYLVVTEMQSILPAVKGHFYYTQKHILEVIVPKLQADAMALLQCGSKSMVQDAADRSGKVLYWSKVNVDDKDFSKQGTYEMVYPATMSNDEREKATDEIMMTRNLIAQWVAVIAEDERQQVNTIYGYKPWKTMELSGGVVNSFSETVAGNQSLTMKMNTDLATTAVSMLFALPSILEKTGISGFDPTLSYEYDKGKTETISANGDKLFKYVWTPVVVPTIDYTPTETQGKNRTVSVNLVIGDGYTTIGVYRSLGNKFNEEEIKSMREGAFKTGFVGGNRENDPGLQSADFIYAIEGGATHCPYIPEVRTKYYLPGTLLSMPTKKINIPGLDIDKREATNVPQGSAATFKVKMWADSELDASLAITKYQGYSLSVLDESNPDGLAFSIDGQSINTGRAFSFNEIGVPMYKTLEVRRPENSQKVDFENVMLVMTSTCDPTNMVMLPIDVHFVPTSTPLTITTPSDKWVINTNSLLDSESDSYYMPVVISDYDQNYPNFDRIELQYKYSTQSDDDWVTQVAYYADKELYDKANGTKEMLPEGGTITGLRFFGDRTPKAIEQNYDIRAVSYCRYGSGYVMKSSNIISGMKDTRRPRVFGSISPADGILNYGESITIPFSEPIAANLLQEDRNFYIRSFYAGSEMDLTEALTFNGEEGTVAETEVSRSFENDSSFTVTMQVKTKTHDKDMVLFATSDNRIEFGLSAEGGLYGNIGGKESRTVAKAHWSDTFSTVTMYYDAENDTVAYYVNTDMLAVKNGDNTADFRSGAAGRLRFGSDVSGQKALDGSIADARIWIGNDAKRLAFNAMGSVLTGKEKGLLAYYHMNEGFGTEINDYAHGATLKLKNGADWSNADGMALKFDGTEGVKLAPLSFQRSDLQDFTLSFWFKMNQESNGRDVALFASGNGDVENDGKIYIGVNAEGNPVVKSNGNTFVSEKSVNDGKWHYYALAVNRSTGVASVFVDNKTVNTFSAYKMGGMTDNGTLFLGGRYSPTDAKVTDNVFNGYIDGLALWASALTEPYVELYSQYAPMDTDPSLMVYAPFEMQVSNDNGMLETHFNARNSRKTYDKYGNFVSGNEVIFATDDMDALAPYVSKNVHASGCKELKMKKLDFDWAARDNDLVINIKNQDSDINGNYVFISLSNVEDLRGNTMESAMNTVVLMNRSQLFWDDQMVTRTVERGTKDVFTMKAINVAGMPVGYKVENLPSWLTVDYPNGSVSGATYVPLTFTVSQDINVGYHEALVYLTDGNGLSEALLVGVECTSEAPQWNVNTKLTHTMNLIGKVSIKDADGNRVLTDERDIVAAFIGTECVGKQNIVVASQGTANLFMTIYGNTGVTYRNANVKFCLWQASTGKVVMLSPEGTSVNFMPNDIVGTATSPVSLVSTTMKMQNIEMTPGWNWLSFNVKTGSIDDSFTMVNTPSRNDVVKSYDKQQMMSYNGSKWVANGDAIKTLDHKGMYMFYSKDGNTISALGETLVSDEDRTVTLHRGWNSLPYLLEDNTDVNVALADYYGKATENDVVKGYRDFAVFDAANGKWVGTLNSMKPGQGYMLRRMGDGEVTMTYYPSAIAQRFLRLGTASEQVEPVAVGTVVGNYSTNMPIIAVLDESTTEQIGNQSSPVLRAYADGEVVAEATADDQGRYFLLASAREGSRMSFAIMNDDMVTARTAPLLDYNESGMVGTLSNPYVVDFIGTQLSVGPSPFSEYLLWSAAAHVGDAVTLELFSQEGKSVFRHDDVADTTNYSFRQNTAASLTDGVYIARMTVAGKSRIFKIIKK